MLNSITIHNIVLIDRLEIKFGAGKSKNNFCVLTGETGSGKSILLDALGLAIGYRSNSRLLRKGESAGLVVAEFDISDNSSAKEILKENGLINPDDKNSLILRRTLTESGSKAFVNDISVGVNLLSQIGESLIEIHGQHEQNKLLTSSFHRIILDEYANHQGLVSDVADLFEKLDKLKKDLQKLYDEALQNEREKDYLEHTVKELEAAKIVIGEEENLTANRNLLLNGEKINNLLSEIASDLAEVDNKIFSSNKSLIRNQNLGDIIKSQNNENKLEKLIAVLDEVSAKNEEARSIVDSALSSLDTGELNLTEIEERLFLLKNLSRKFNVTTDELPEFLNQTKEKLGIVANFSVLTRDLEKQREKIEKEYLKKAEELSESRQKAALRLTKKVEDELSFLKMSAVKFAVKIEKLTPEQYNKNGIDSVRFAAATNASSNLDDISKIASGGELSRFMLALKVALLEIKSTPILIFDEIDSGIGGSVADAVGNRLKLLSKNSQILVVTHHPQISAKSNYHLRVEKNTNNEITKTNIEILDEKAKEKEIARMLSGETITDEALAAARRLMVNE